MNIQKTSLPRVLVIGGGFAGLAAINIADKLFVTIDTICYHAKNIYKKSHVNSKLGAIKKYLGATLSD